MAMSDDVSRFMGLFIGNDRSFGQWYPETGKMLTMKEPYTSMHVEAHLKGDTGLGMVPVLDDGMCRFGVIDIDAHGLNEQAIDCVALAAAVEKLKLPLTVCRSKGRGAHLYLFCKEPILAPTIRSTLARWADMLGYSGSEIFPKQDKLHQQALGNWINLPYFGDTRKAVEGGKEADLAFFFENAANRSIDMTILTSIFAGDDYAEAPPCLQRLITKPIPQGENIRNNGLMLAATFFRKAFPDNWQNRAFDFNAKHMAVPVEHSEAKRLVGSVNKKDYGYKCKEEPCASLCDRATCVTRRFGISRGGGDPGDLPQIERVVRHIAPGSSEVKWEVTIDGQTMYFTGKELRSPTLASPIILDALKFVMPSVKQDVWASHINKYIADCEDAELPSEATEAGFIRSRLHEWLRKYIRPGEEEKRRQQLLHGNPALVIINEERLLAFKLDDFRLFLKRTRTEEMKGINLQITLHRSGVQTRRIRIGNRTTTVWVVPELDITNHQRDPIEVEDEL